MENEHKATSPQQHDLYKTGDPDAPDSIKDRNGEVVLGLCRRCNKGEIELAEECVEVIQRAYFTDPESTHVIDGRRLIIEKISMGGIVIDLATGDTEMPSGMSPNEASRLFWIALKDHIKASPL